MSKWPRSNAKEGVTHIPLSSKIEASSSNSLVLCTGQFLVTSNFSALMESADSTVQAYWAVQK